MAKKKVFVSFDFENDKQYKYLLNGWNSNPYFEFSFDDKSSQEINSSNIAVVKRALSRKINEADYTLVIVGEEANKLHKDYKEIGYRNWQNYEVAKSKEHGNNLIGVKINSNYAAPEELLGAGASWALSFRLEKIIQALNSI